MVGGESVGGGAKASDWSRRQVVLVSAGAGAVGGAVVATGGAGAAASGTAGAGGPDVVVGAAPLHGARPESLRPPPGVAAKRQS